jgi:transposase
MGRLRGTYNKYDSAVRLRIIKEAESGGDWVETAHANGVPYKTAHSWLRTGFEVNKSRGGSRINKLNAEQVAVMVSWLEEDCQMTLLEIRDRVELDMNVSITSQAVSKYLDG